jgi:hypothetical protein
MISYNVAITGTSSSLGNIIKTALPTKNITEFNNVSDISAIIEETKDIEIFVNYEYNNNLQLEITKKWFEVHQNKKHLIINILWAESQGMSDSEWADYFQAKKDLNEFSWEVNLAEKNCLCILISPGLEDNQIDDNDRVKRFKESKLDISKEIIDIINWTITKFYEV